jgi:two-component system heavy metal sensor histidine kinase CusS
MISGMLFLAQTENDADNLRLADVDLAESVRGLFEYFEAWAEDRAVSLDLQGRAAPIRGDEEMLRRAIGNLLSNAIRYSPRDAAVTVKLSQDESRTTVLVENAGEKIPAEALHRIFDRFYRADPSRQRKGEGAGLGLAIVKSVAEAHGGTVQVVSDDSLTRFELVLPRSA